MWVSLDGHDFGPGDSAAQAILEVLTSDRTSSRRGHQSFLKEDLGGGGLSLCLLQAVNGSSFSLVCKLSVDLR